MYFSESNETDQIIIIETFENVQTKWHWSKNFSGIYSHHLTSVTLTTLGTGAGITLCYDHQWQHQDCSNVWDWCQWRIQESLVTSGCKLLPTMISVSIIKQWSMWLILLISLVLVQNIKWKLYNHQEQFSSSLVQCTAARSRDVGRAEASQQFPVSLSAQGVSGWLGWIWGV